MATVEQPERGSTHRPGGSSGGASAAGAARPSGGRIGGLDALRGIAAVGVVLFHYTVMHDQRYGYDGPRTFLFEFGVYGVQLFFMISGFVIFMTVEKTRRPIDFVVSRFARLYPAYWLALALTTAVMACLPGPNGSVGLAKLGVRAVANLPMFQGWFGIQPIDLVYWTLHIEMTFYVIMFFVLWSGRLDRTIPVLLTLVALGAIHGLISARFAYPWLDRLRNILALDYLHLLTIGVLLFEFRRRPRLIYLLPIALLIFVPYSQPRTNPHPMYDVVATVLIVSVVWLATTGRLPWLENRVLVFFGAISYTLYLIHDRIGHIVIYHLDQLGLPHLLSVAIMIGTAIGTATAMTFLFERPAMKVIRNQAERWVGSGRRPVEALISPQVVPVVPQGFEA